MKSVVCVRTIDKLLFLVESVKAIKNETIAEDEDVQQRGEVEKQVAEIRNADNSNDSKEEDDRLFPGTTLFVKNLSFRTTDEGLKNKFESRFRIRSATISKKRGDFLFWSVMGIALLGKIIRIFIPVIFNY